MTNKKQKLVYLMDAVFFVVTANEIFFITYMIASLFGVRLFSLLLQINEFMLDTVIIQGHIYASLVIINMLFLTVDILYIKLRKKIKPYESLTKPYKKAISFFCVTGTIMSVFYITIFILTPMY